MFAYEVFVSYEQYRHSKLTEEEKARTPASLIEKLEHDENNPDRENYKPGYVLLYLLFYFAVQMILMVNVLMKEISEFGLDVMLVLTLIYLIIVWKWKPYNEEVNFHNKALRLNHFAAFWFVLTCEFFNRVEISASVFVGMVYLSLVLLLAISLCGYGRLYVEYRFRKRLQDDPNLMDEKKKELVREIDAESLKMSKK
jgi:hypothetical protein